MYQLSIEIAKNIYSNKILKYIVIAFAGSILLTISAKIKIPFYPVPMTMQTFVVILLGVTFGYKAGAAAVCLYLVEGISGLPVFSNSPEKGVGLSYFCLLYTSPSPRDRQKSRMPSSA